MYLSKKLTVCLTDVEANYIGHMMYAASKLWNVANYEKRNWEELGLEAYPSLYDQECRLKDNLWYRQLPSQTAQQVLKRLEEAWKSFFALKTSGGIENPRPPRFKQENIQIDYVQNGIKKTGDDTIRLSLPTALKAYLEKIYGLHANFLFVQSPCFGDMEQIKRVSFMELEDGIATLVVVYEIPDVPKKADNGHWLGIDLGINNPFTCVDSVTGESFILGREYFSKARWFDKKIAHYQSINASQQAVRGIKYPKTSKRILTLYKKKNNVLHDYLHKCTKEIANYCQEHDITKVIIGDLTGIRKGTKLGAKTNQKLHKLPYLKIYAMLEYKLALRGITLVRQEESYTSQVPPSAPKVSKKYTQKENRIKRGLYYDGNNCYNADGVGAYNILKKYSGKFGLPFTTPSEGIRTPNLVKVAA